MRAYSICCRVQKAHFWGLSLTWSNFEKNSQLCSSSSSSRLSVNNSFIPHLCRVVAAHSFLDDSFSSSCKVFKSKDSSVVNWQLLERIPRRSTETFQPTIPTTEKTHGTNNKNHRFHSVFSLLPGFTPSLSNVRSCNQVYKNTKIGCTRSRLFGSRE